MQDTFDLRSYDARAPVVPGVESSLRESSREAAPGVVETQQRSTARCAGGRNVSREPVSVPTGQLVDIEAWPSNATRATSQMSSSGSSNVDYGKIVRKWKIS